MEYWTLAWLQYDVADFPPKIFLVPWTKASSLNSNQHYASHETLLASECSFDSFVVV